MSIHRAIASLKAAIASLDIATGAFDDEHLNEALTAAQLQIGNAATMIFAVQADNRAQASQKRVTSGGW